MNSENSNGLTVVCRPSDAFYVDIAREIYIFRARSVFFVRDLCMFRLPHAHDVFVDPGFEPLTLQHDRFVGPGFDFWPQSPVSGPCIRGLCQ